MTAIPQPSAPPQPSTGTPWEVFLAFLRLGLTSFGGPVAHLGYFRSEFVDRRGWLDDRSYAELVALCQFLPGPASSQVGFALGLSRAGWAGALLAWLGFTAPSAVALMLFAEGVARSPALATSGAVQGLKVAAVAVVAQAVWGMARSLCPDLARRCLAVGAATTAMAWPGTPGQIAAIAGGAIAGRLLLTLSAQPALPHRPVPVRRRTGVLALAAFALLLVTLPVLASSSGSRLWALIEGFYRAGALVFGGGHVVLPLLQAVVVPTGAVGNAEFVAGYGAAQAVPGPLFTFAAYLGAVIDGWVGGLLLLCVIFVPAFLLVVGTLPFWDAWRTRPGTLPAVAGINAAVVGVLLAALIDPVWPSAIHGPIELAIALAGFAALVFARISPLWVVGTAAMAGSLLL